MVLHVKSSPLYQRLTATFDKKIKAADLTNQLSDARITPSNTCLLLSAAIILSIKDRRYVQDEQPKSRWLFCYFCVWKVDIFMPPCTLPVFLRLPVKRAKDTFPLKALPSMLFGRFSLLLMKTS